MAQDVSEMAKLCSQPLLITPSDVSTVPVAALQPDAAVTQEAWTPRWYVASTRSRHERTVQEQLVSRSIECYLPLYSSQRQWHDRKKQIMLPAFAGYIFVRLPFAQRVNVLTVPGVTRLVMFGSKPASLPDDELDRWRTALASRKCEPHPYLAAGARVRIVSGPMRGLCGVVVRGQGLRIVISVDCLCRSISVELQESDLRPE